MRLPTLLAVPIMIFLAGCGGGRSRVAEKVEVMQGDEQCAIPGQECEDELRIEFLSAKQRGFFGGKGKRHPVPGIKPVFTVEPGSELEIIPIDEVSDAGGMFRARIKAGHKVGDQYFKVSVDGSPKASYRFRVISGIKVDGDRQEAFSGRKLSRPITVQVFDEQGNPRPGVPVYFSLVSCPGSKSGSKLSNKLTVSDAAGLASTEFTVGKSTGAYTISAEIGSAYNDASFRSIEIKAYGKNFLGISGLIVTVLGGLAIFIFGMKSMTDGLQLVAGDKMKSILHFFTSNRVSAIGAGALVTGVIQSSSACTVMVVGFVNAGLLNLSQAIGIVFGANIGTTVTAQIISFKLGLLALPAVIAGLLLTLLFKRVLVQGWGQTILGFGMLFYGLGIMSYELKLISKFPSVIEFFQKFDCTPLAGSSTMPLLSILGAIAIGTAMTVIIQSSSATIGIALALAGSGLINFYTAVPLILGDNIGTTITANLAAIGANRRSKQTALAHFLFNFLGAFTMVILFFIPAGRGGPPVFLALIDKITPGDVFSYTNENITRHIAMAHSLFNVCNVLIFLPFIPQIARLCNIIIPIKDESGDPIKILEPHLLDTPSIAIEQSVQSMRGMVKDSWSMIEHAVNELILADGKVSEELVVKLTEEEERVDTLQAEITDYLIQLTGRRLTEPQTEIIPLLIHCVNDAERVADHAENLIGIARRLKSKKNRFSEDAVREIEKLWRILRNQAQHVVTALNQTDRRDVKVALKDERKINKLTDKFEQNHIKRLKSGTCKVVSGILFLELIHEMEKIGDHLTNIAERTPEIQQHHLAIGE